MSEDDTVSLAEYERIEKKIKSELAHDFDKKFTALFKQQDDMSKSIFELTELVKPMATWWNNYKGFKATIVPAAKVIIFIGTFLGALYVVAGEIKRFFNSH